jgi:hypothetical protein
MHTELADGHIEGGGAVRAPEPRGAVRVPEPVDADDRRPSPADSHDAAPEISIDRVDRLLDDVETALARLDDGTYGQCVTCGSVIDDARLAAEPTVQSCGACGAAPTSPATGPLGAAGVPDRQAAPAGPPAGPPSGPPVD